MKIENYKEFKEFKTDCIKVLKQSVSEDYAKYIYTSLRGDLIEDEETACGDCLWYNDDDIRLAIGRVLCNRLGIEV